MKKILLTLALAAFAFTANAQWVVGGNIGANHNMTNHDKDYNMGTATTNIKILPKVGYWLNDNMQVGLSAGWDYSYTRNYTGGGEKYYTSDPSSQIVIAPYLRYNLTSWKNFTIFAEASLSFTIHPETSHHVFVDGTETTTDNGDSWNKIGINVVPGLNYAFTEHFSMDLYINLARLYWSMTSTDNGGRHDWGIGANANAQTLNAHLDNFMIGFNYAF